MKKFIAFLLTFVMIFSTLFCVNVLAADVNVDMGDFFKNYSVKAGSDAGYVKETSGTATAYPLDGNEVDGWYKDDVKLSDAAEYTFPADAEGTYVAKFVDNNLLAAPNGTFDNAALGTDLIGTTWHMSGKDEGWEAVTVTDVFANSGKQSLMFLTRNQGDIYTTLTNLEKNKYYTVSFNWMRTNSVITNSDTAQDYFGGAIVTTTNVNTFAEAKDINCLVDDYAGNNNTYIGGKWNKTQFNFYSGENTELRLFIDYYALGKKDNYQFELFVDDLTVYMPEDQDAIASDAKFKTNVSGEKTYAYASTNAAVSYGTEVWVAATPEGGYTFDGWYENGVKVSKEKIYKFNVTGQRTLVAKSVLTTEYTPDVDFDGNLNLYDLVMLAQSVADWDVMANDALSDVNDDEQIDLDDVTLLAKYFAGWNVEEQLATNSLVLPENDGTKDNLLSGTSEYYNTNTVLNEGNKIRIANVLKKAQNGDTINIVGFGGSITEGTGAEKIDNVYNSYAAQVAKWFETTFPNATINYTNAGIGSTTSLVGVHRMEADVLDKNPDFVIVDFTANDNPNGDTYKLPYEAIIRRLLENDIAVLSVFFGHVNGYSDKKELTYTRSNDARYDHLHTLIHYDIPTIDYYGSLWQYFNDTITWYDVAQDYIHPNSTGHLMAASAINAYLADVLADADKIATDVPEIPDYLNSKSAVYATATLAEPTSADGDCEFTEAIHNNHFDGYVLSDGATLAFEVEAATSISVFLERKYGAGTATIKVNGEEVLSVNLANDSNYIWLDHYEIFDEPQDVTVEIVASGTVGVPYLGVTY